MTGHSRSHGIVTLLDSNHCPRTATLFDLTTKPQICVVKKSWNMHCQLERPAVGCGPSFLPLCSNTSAPRQPSIRPPLGMSTEAPGLSPSGVRSAQAPPSLWSTSSCWSSCTKSIRNETGPDAPLAPRWGSLPLCLMSPSTLSSRLTRASVRSGVDHLCHYRPCAKFRVQ